MAVTYTANLNVSMEQIFSGIQYTLLHEENGAEAVNPNAPSIALSPYAIQIAGGWNTQTHEYGGPLSFNVERLGPGDSLTSDRYVLSSQNDLVIWDRETSDGSDYMFSTNVNPNDPPASFDSRYGLPGLSGGDNGAFSQTNAIEIFDLGAGNDVISLVYNNATVDGVVGVAYTGNVTVYGGTGFDVAWSGAGNDYLYGGDGADTLYGGAGNDTIEGGAGGNVDLLFGPDGFRGDLIDGGSGVNWVNYSGSAAAVHVILNNDQFGTATGTGGDAQGDTVRRVNNLIGSSAGNDTLDGNTSANTIIGLGGNDTIYGGDDGVGGDFIYGDDTLGAVSGNDRIFGGAGSDTVFGGLGDDFVEGSAGSDSLTGGTGEDTLSYSQSSAAVNVTLGGTGTGGDAQGDTVAADFEHLRGSDVVANGDVLVGSAIVNTIIGGLGADTIEGRGGADVLIGGGQGDWVSYASSAAVTVNLALATAQVSANDASGDVLSGFQHLLGSAGNDLLTGDTQANSIIGGGGGDTIYGGDDAAGGDAIFGDDAAGLLSGNDRLFGGTGNDTAFGGLGDDLLAGSAGTDSLFGGAGNDTLSYAASSAFVNVTLGGGGLNGDAQGDVLGTDFETLVGSAFNDILVGDANANVILGGDLADSIRGGAGIDRLFGELGVDTIEGGSEGDTLAGGVTAGAAGQGDWVSYANSGAVTVNLALATAQVSANDAGGDVLSGFQHLIGSGAGDILTGDGQANSIVGGSGVDTIQGAAGADTLFGGGNGDWVSYASSAAVTVNLALATAQVSANDASGDVLSGFQHLLGSGGSDLLTGDTQANSIIGGGGGDTIYGGDDAAGGDVLFGDDVAGLVTGNDRLFGGTGNDTAFGGLGDDLLAGSAGADSLSGGAGNDTLSYAASSAFVNVTLGGSGLNGDAQGDVIGNDFETLVGSAFNDILVGDANANVILGGDLADSISGGAGIDRLFGELGVDTIEGGAEGDTLVGSTAVGAAGEGDWVSYAGSTAVTVDLRLATAQVSAGDAGGDVLSGFQHLIGSTRGDILIGDTQANSIVAGGGVDTVEGGAGADALFGGGNGDWVSYAGSATGVTVNLTLATQVSAGDAGGDALTGFQHLIGSGQADTLTGDGQANSIFGGLGVDTIEGGLGNDVLDGRVSLGAANEGDWLSYANASGAVSASFFGGTATGAAGTDTISGFQHLLGSANADFLEGDDDLDNSVVGGGGTDTLRGLGGIDTLFGGDANDLMQIGNNGGTFIPTTVSGWDGDAGSATINVSVAADVARVGDYAFGGNGIDTLDMASLTSGSARTLYMRLNPDGTPSSNSNISGFLAGVEIIVAGTAADIINLTFNDGVTRTAYAENISIFAGTGGDVVFSGSGNDLIAGGNQAAGAADGADTLFGGQGNDTVFGDDFVGGSTGGGDTLFGGGGLDTLFGGAANDVLIDTSGGGSLSGDEGADLLVLDVVGPIDGIYAAHGGKDEPGADGADRVFAAGTYGTIDASLGADADVFISSSVDSGSAQVDRVSGDSGNDAISSWHGADTLDGGAGNDVLWGGAGVDTIMGGDDTDVLYGGAGDGDLLIGGGSADYYYWARNDGNDRIEDRDTDSISGDEGENYILVFSGFQDPANPNDDLNDDSFIDGAGVFEADGNLYDNDGDDMVQLVVDVNDNTIYHLTVLTGEGAGSTLTFDRDEISVIALWNSDATPGMQVITGYRWVDDMDDPLGGRYELVP